jgi:putative nucleotidyltransferase with HDIG domain
MLDNMHERALQVKEHIQKLSSLPSLAVVKYQLVKTLSRDGSSVEDIADIIKHDPAITSRIMAIANSAFFAYPGRIGSIDQAVLLLGFDLVRSISLASSMFNIFASQYGNLKRIWAHSYVVASIAGNLCKKNKCCDGGSCFLSGLLHDIGRLALIRIAVEGNMEGHMQDLSGLRGDALMKAEVAKFGCSHPEAAKWFLEHLCFPDEIIKPIETHHNPEAGAHADVISKVIYVADGLASLIFQDLDNDGEWTEDHKRLFHELDMADSDMDEIRATVEKERSSIAEFFDL